MWEMVREMRVIMREMRVMMRVMMRETMVTG